MGASVAPEPLSDHDLYDQFRDRGLSHADAVKRVEFRRTVVANTATRNSADVTAAARGAIEPELAVGVLPGFSRTETALVMGVGGSIGSGLATKLIGKLLPVAVTVGKNAGGIAMKLVGRLTGSAAKAAAPEVKQ